MKTNALEFISALGELPVKIPIVWRLKDKIRHLSKSFVSMDDFDWDDYTIQYGAWQKENAKFFTDDLRQVEFKLVEGGLYTLGDCKPINPTRRCVWEALCNLPKFDSVAEIGTGAGHFIVGMGVLLGSSVRLSAYDLSRRQLDLFKELYPKEFAAISTGLLDITLSPINDSAKPDVVFASTVLMHIQRPVAYNDALVNLLLSGRRFSVLMDNWNTHDYFLDLTTIREKDDRFHGCRFYSYDSGANVAIVVSRCDELKEPYRDLTKAILKKYLS